VTSSSDPGDSPRQLVDAVSCPSCAYRYDNLHVADAKGRPRELRCGDCGAGFYVARCPACRNLTTHLELPPRDGRSYERDAAGIKLTQQVRCSDCGKPWHLPLPLAWQDVTSRGYWRARMARGPAVGGLVACGEPGITQLLAKTFGYVILLGPVLGLLLALTIVLFGLLLAVTLSARRLWSDYPLVIIAAGLLVAGSLLVTYLLARRRRVDSALARAYVAVVLGPVAYLLIIVGLFAYGVLRAG
jgi:hypothetical protein